MNTSEPRDGWTQEQIDQLVRKAKEISAPNLFLVAGNHPFIKSGNTLHEMKEFPVVTERVLVDSFRPILSPEEMETWESKGSDVEKTYIDPQGHHIRINCYTNVKGKGVTCRILHRIPTFTELSPQGIETLSKLSNSTKGLIIITGMANTGKTTTLAAFIDHINRHHCRTILTIEKPVQFYHQSQSSLVMQRQVGLHCPDYRTGILSGLRSDVDIIMIDEIHTNDYETFYSALVAAESAAVFTSFRSFGGAGWTMQKLVDSAPADQRDLILSRLARVIRGILWQDLVAVDNSYERRPVMEIMFNTSRIAKLIRKRDFYSIEAEIEKTEGMITMRQSVGAWREHMILTSDVLGFLEKISSVGLLLL